MTVLPSGRSERVVAVDIVEKCSSARAAGRISSSLSMGNVGAALSAALPDVVHLAGLLARATNHLGLAWVVRGLLAVD